MLIKLFASTKKKANLALLYSQQKTTYRSIIFDCFLLGYNVLLLPQQQQQQQAPMPPPPNPPIRVDNFFTCFNYHLTGEGRISPVAIITR